MQISKDSTPDFILAINNLENRFKGIINLNNAYKNRELSQSITALIENAKYSNAIGRNKRAWAFFILANKLLVKVVR